MSCPDGEWRGEGKVVPVRPQYTFIFVIQQAVTVIPVAQMQSTLATPSTYEIATVFKYAFFVVQLIRLFILSCLSSSVRQRSFTRYKNILRRVVSVFSFGENGKC